MTFRAEESRALGVALGEMPFPESRYAGIAIRAEDTQPVSRIENLPPNILDLLGLEPALVAAGGGSYNPGQIRVPKGNKYGGRWMDAAGKLGFGLEQALNRSLNRLGPGVDIGEQDVSDVEAVRAARRARAEAVLKEEGRPTLQQSADRMKQIYALTTPEQREAGRIWYDEAGKLADEMVANPATDLTKEQAAAIIAHLSTQTRWDANADYARSFASGLTMDEANAHLKAEVLAGRVPRAKQGGDGIIGTNWAKAEKAKLSDDPIGRDNKNLGTFSEANKTRTFAANIMGDRDGVTIDTHQMRAVGQGLDPIGNIPGPINPKTGKAGKDPRGNKDLRGDRIYEALAESVRIAADEVGITPAEMQAVTWVWAQGSHVDARKGHPGRLVDMNGSGLVLPDRIGDEYTQALIDSGDLVAAAGPVESEDDYAIPDYYYAMLEKLLGTPRPDDEEEEPLDDAGSIADTLIAAGGWNEGQRRVRPGNRTGGQWLDDAGRVAANLEATAKIATGPLGAPGPPRTYDQLDDDPVALVNDTNPGWNEFPDEEMYQANCQRVVSAVEMRARGYDKAVANAFDGNDTDAAIEYAWTDPVTGRSRPFSDPPLTQSQLATTFRQYPVGSRFILGGWSEADQYGHVWNAEITENGMIELDAQGGSTPGEKIHEAFDELIYIRVDDLVPSEMMFEGFGETPLVTTREEMDVPYRQASADPVEAGVAAGYDVVETRDLGDYWHLIVTDPPQRWSDRILVMDKATEEVSLIPRFDVSLTAAGGFDAGQKRVQKGNREGGQWIDDAGRIAGALEGAADGIPGHGIPLVEWDSDEFRARADEFASRTGGSFDTPSEFCGYGESYWAKNAYAMTGYDKNKATIVDELPAGSKPIYRGLGANRAESEKYIEQYKTGEHFAGKGIFGAGSYFAADREEAGEYAGWLREQDGGQWSDHTDLIKSALKPEARVLTIDNNKNGTDEGGHMGYLNQIRAATGGQEFIKGAGVVGGMNISRDIGAAAALAGYDAIQVVNLGRDNTGSYTVVLNRGATYVTAENEAE